MRSLKRTCSRPDRSWAGPRMSHLTRGGVEPVSGPRNEPVQPAPQSATRSTPRPTVTRYAGAHGLKAPRVLGTAGRGWEGGRGFRGWGSARPYGGPLTSAGPSAYWPSYHAVLDIMTRCAEDSYGDGRLPSACGTRSASRATACCARRCKTTPELRVTRDFRETRLGLRLSSTGPRPLHAGGACDSASTPQAAKGADGSRRRRARYP